MDYDMGEIIGVIRSQTVQRIFTINTGSSSLKVACTRWAREEMRLLSGLRRIGVPGVVYASQTPTVRHCRPGG